jgi:hypothetical protein
MKQYFALLNLPCETGFQEKVSRSLRLSLTPSPEVYAEFAQTYEGRCPLLLEDGWCGLHKQCGEAALPGVCRLYPRIHRGRFGPEASLANSCERTLELLFENDRPLTFRLEWIQASIASTEMSNPHASDVVMTQRAAVLNHFSDRSRSFAQRLASLPAILPSSLTVSNTESLNNPIDGTFELSKVLQVLRHLILRFSNSSRQLEELAGEADWHFDESAMERQYNLSKAHLNSILPNHEVHFEKMIVHHLFSRGFPYLEGFQDPKDAWIALIGTHAFLRYFALTMLSIKQTMNDFVDLMARLFRVIAHSRFEEKMRGFLREAEGDDPQTLAMLCAF